MTRVFCKTRALNVYLHAYRAAAPLLDYVTFYRDQARAFETPALAVTEALDNRLKTLPVKLDVNLERLSPGRYTCQVTVLDPAASKAAFWQAPRLVIR